MSAAPVKSIGLAVHPQFQRATDAVDRVIACCEKHGVDVITIDEICDKSGNRLPEVVISVGGDGTLLTALQTACAQNIPVWGVNVGRLGFLTTSGINEIEDGVEKLVEGDYSVEYRSRLHAKVTGTKEDRDDILALNDIVLHRRFNSGIAVLEAELDGRFLASYEVDGLIIATPTGSTAYSLSAGGSILSPTLPAFIITPICAHSMSARPLVVDDSSHVVLRPKFDRSSADILMMADGQEASKLDPEDSEVKVSIGKAERDAGLVRFEEVIFSDVLRDKLGWSGGIPLDKSRFER
ncbi:MAG TPA: NAD(+)/NADH kinase [bacterium]|jgi:NAD+ kinase